MLVENEYQVALRADLRYHRHVPEDPCAPGDPTGDGEGQVTGMDR
jgi:hypothetical protein